jgi:hypothetical protein
MTESQIAALWRDLLELQALMAHPMVATQHLTLSEFYDDEAL